MVQLALEAAEELAERRHLGRGDRSAHAAPARHRDHRRLGQEDQPPRHASRKAGPSPASAREIAALVMEQAFDWLDAPVKRVTGKDVPLPYAANLEQLALPQAEDIVAAAKAVRYAKRGAPCRSRS